MFEKSLLLLKDGKLDPATWPNEGIGRINPDGSKGSCSICHSRHTFSLAIARQPESCGYCHLGPDHPHEEIYTESKHGVTYRSLIGQMNLNADKWVLGKDYNVAPTCNSCHTGATTKLPVTHDVGARLSWNLRPEIAIRQKDWEKKRADMKSVCLHCHGTSWVDNFYTQFDGVVNLGNDKFFGPAKEIMGKLNKPNGLRPNLGQDLMQDELDWDEIQKETKQFVELTEALGKNKPPLGEKDSWEKLTKGYVEKAKAMDAAAQKKDKKGAAAAHQKLSIMEFCNECHNVHRKK